jgi:hypothetical protein
MIEHDDVADPDDAPAPGHVVHGGAVALEALDLVVEQDPDTLIDELLGLLRGLEMRCHASATQQALGVALLERIRALCADVGRRAEAPFTVAVAGQFKRGKSTLVNALLGEAVAPMDTLPETLAFTRYGWGPAFTAELRLQGGGRIALRRDHLPRAALAPVMAAAPAPAVGVEVTLPVPWLQHVTLVDMPGLGDLGPELRKQVLEHIAAADLLVIMVSGGLPLSDEERQLLLQGIKPHDFSKLLFVVNRVDQIDPAELPRLRAHVEQLRGDFPGMRVHLLSALDELRRLTQGARPAAARGEQLAAMFAGFRQDLHDLVMAQRSTLRADRLAAAGSMGLSDFEMRLRMLCSRIDKQRSEVDAELQGLQQAASGLAQDLVQRRAALSSAVQDLSVQAQDWMRAFGLRLAATLSEQTRATTRADLERDMQFFVGARVQSALDACLQAHAPALSAIGAGMLGETASLDAGPDVAAAARVAAQLYTGAQWSTEATVRLVLDKALGLGAVVDGVAGVLALASPGIDAGDYDRLLRSATPGLVKALADAAQATYAKVETGLLERLEHEYLQRRDAQADASAQASRLHRDRQQDLQAMSAAAADALEGVVRTRLAVDALRLRLPAPSAA